MNPQRIRKEVELKVRNLEDREAIGEIRTHFEQRLGVIRDL